MIRHLVSIFVLLTCTLALFHYLRIMSFPRIDDGNNFAQYMFDERVPGAVRDEECPNNWRSRVVACQTSAWWLELWGKPHPPVHNVYGTPGPNGQFGNFYIQFPPQPYIDVFASYFAAWFLATGLLLMLFSKAPPEARMAQAAMILAGIVSDTPSRISPNFYPWDFAAMFFFTAAFLVWSARGPSRGWAVPLVLLVILGGLFKETVLVAALFLLSLPVKLGWRLFLVAAVIGVALGLSYEITGGRLPDWKYSLQHAAGLSHFKCSDLFRAWPILGANIGLVAALPFLLWFRRHEPGAMILMIVVGCFMAGQCLNNLAFGIYDENREWLDLLPLGAILATRAMTFPRSHGQRI